jgi:hypothetical protein
MKKELSPELSSQVQKIMALFYEINPSINFANKTQRGSAEWMIKRWGIDAVEAMTKKVIECQGKEFAPVATNPYEMKEKLSRFVMYFHRNNQPKPQQYEG